MDRVDNPDMLSALQQAEDLLRAELPSLDRLNGQTRRSLLAAEFLHRQIEEIGPSADLTRAAGFSYSFAVENESKIRLGPRLKRFFEEPGTPGLLSRLLEPRGDRLSVYYERYLLRTLRASQCEATPENYFHTFQRMLDHGPRYRPDGLKALGIIVIAFGRFYSFTKQHEEVEMYNPLRLSGLTDSDAVLAFGVDLINLQHARNPYIHPELGEPRPTGELRDRTLALLRTLAVI